jgi:hypothetical protein
MKLYTFKKTSWHVRLFEWLFGENPTHKYKTMCPYFWTYVLIFLFLPLILIIKAFGKYGTQFLSWTKDYKQNKQNAAINHMKIICSNPNLTPYEAYKIMKSKCYKEHFYYEIEYDVRIRLGELENIYLANMRQIKHKKEAIVEARRERFVNTYETYKEYKWFNYLSYIISFGLIVVIIYAVIYSAYIGGSMVNWQFVGKWTLIITIFIIAAAIVIGITYAVIKYVIYPFIGWISCIKLPTCGICENVKNLFSYFIFLWIPFKYISIGIYRFFAIIVNMIYSTYKKQCPIITWED